MKSQDIFINDKIVKGIEIPLQNATLILLIAPKGYIACGYWNMGAAEKFGDAACIVKGVKTVEEALKARVVAVSSAAKNMGIVLGMTTETALCKLL